MRSVLCFLTIGASLLAGEFAIGSKVTGIPVTDHGRALTIKPSAAKATAVIFVSVQCPVSNAYNERMAALYKDYSSKGVQFAFVNANATEPAAEVDQHAKAQNWSFPVYKDEANRLADDFNAQVTPEVYLFDQAGTLVYHGRIDNSRDTAKVNTNEARAALDAVLAAKPVSTPEAKAFGCTIKRGKRTS